MAIFKAVVPGRVFCCRASVSMGHTALRLGGHCCKMGRCTRRTDSSGGGKCPPAGSRCDGGAVSLRGLLKAASLLRTGEVARLSSLSKLALPSGNSNTTVEPSKKRPNSSPFWRVMGWVRWWSWTAGSRPGQRRCFDACHDHGATRIPAGAVIRVEGTSCSCEQVGHPIGGGLFPRKRRVRRVSRRCREWHVDDGNPAQVMVANWPLVIRWLGAVAAHQIIQGVVMPWPGTLVGMDGQLADRPIRRAGDVVHRIGFGRASAFRRG